MREMLCVLLWFALAVEMDNEEEKKVEKWEDVTLFINEKWFLHFDMG